MSDVPESIRQQVKRRASGRCEYCRIPETNSVFGFHVAHIHPVEHGGSSDLENLAWACLACSVAKGTTMTGYDDETGDIVQLFNPRLQQWADHFDLNGALIVGKSGAGRATVQHLQLNRPEQVGTRETLIKAGLW